MKLKAWQGRLLMARGRWICMVSSEGLVFAVTLVYLRDPNLILGSIFGASDDCKLPGYRAHRLLCVRFYLQKDKRR